jgi:hypothetical protein
MDGRGPILLWGGCFGLPSDLPAFILESGINVLPLARRWSKGTGRGAPFCSKALTKRVKSVEHVHAIRVAKIIGRFHPYRN